VNKKNWLIDISLIILILAMGAFVVIEVSRTVAFVRERTNPAPTETVAAFVEPDLTTDVAGIVAQSFEEGDDKGLVLPGLGGETVALADFDGQPLLINFWATWCPPCVNEMPLLQQYAERYQDDLVVLAINAGEDPTQVRDFISQHQLDLTILLDTDGEAINHFRVYGFPTTLFFDADGEMRSTHIGELDEHLIDKYLLTIGISE